MSKPQRVWCRDLDLRDVTEDFRRSFWSRVDTGAPDACWPWLGSLKPNGYGQVRLNGTMTTASRVALALTRGVVLASDAACHRCDNPPCCNPDHLFAGDSRANTLDSVAKGRANRSRGTAHRDARLTADIVREIRATPVTFGAYRRLARKYGVSDTAIKRVMSRKTWRHVA